jgi:hypothetical protein
MKHALILTLVSLVLGAGPRKPLPGQAGNDNIELVGNVILDREEIKQAVGVDLGPGYVVVRMQITPKMDKPLAIGPDDFTIISHKDGQRSQALEPGEIAGSGVLVVKQAPEKSWGPGTMLNGPTWAGVTPRNTGTESKTGTDTPQTKDGQDKKETNALLDALKAKVLPDKEIKDPVEGLLYFPIDGKIRPKDLTVQYKGPAGRLYMEFAETK